MAPSFPEHLSQQALLISIITTEGASQQMNLKGAQIFRPLYLPHGLLSTDLRRLSQLRSVPAVQAMRLNPEAAGVCAEKPEWINRI